MSLNKKYFFAFFSIIVFSITIIVGPKLISGDVYYFFGSNKLDAVSSIKDPVNRKLEYRDYWGRVITKRGFRKLFGIKIDDGGIIRYSVQVGSTDGDRDAVATAYFIGTQVEPLTNISDIRSEVEKNFDDYYALNNDEFDVGDRIQIITDVIASYLPGSGQFNGVFLIVKSGKVFADFDGIHIPMDMTEEELIEIVEQVRPLEVPVRVGVFKENE